VAADDLDRLPGRLEHEIDRYLAVRHARSAVGEGDAAASHRRALPHALRAALPDRPEGLRQAGDACHADAQHDVRPVDTDVAPALERAPALAARHAPRWQREPRGAVGPVAPIGQRIEHRGYALRD
jgi:hypothetical protein